MNKVTFGRVIKNGLLNYTRNFWLSLAATAIMVITLFIIGSLLIINDLAKVSIIALKEKVDVSVYFHLDAEEAVIQDIQRQLELLPEVKSVAYVPPVEARDRFKELHKDEPLLIESLEQFSDEENPFPASLAIRVRDLGDYQTIIGLFSEQKFNTLVQKITDKRDIVERLSSITRIIQNFGFMLTGVFGLLTILVMFNTIRLTIYSRHEEIEIMRLVGASNSYIRGPFVIEGIVYGAIGAVITAILVFPIIYFFSPKISAFLQLDLQEFNYFGLNFWRLFAIELALGVGMGIISSFIVVRRYLRT